MAWHVVERANGQRFLGTYENEEEARAHHARLIAEDPVYEDVLFVLNDGGGDEPRGEIPEVPPTLGHSAAEKGIPAKNRATVQDASRRGGRPR